MSFPTVMGDGVEGIPLREPQVCLGPAFAQSQYNFFVSGSAFATPANVYQDAGLTNPFPNTGIVNSDAFGRFPPIYLDGSIIYGVQLIDGTGNTTYALDPYTPPLSTRGLSTNVAFGPQIATTGEVVLPAPAAGGSQITLKVTAPPGGTAPLQISSTVAGQSALIINNSVTTGANTATFTATNKPGTATSSPAGWLPVTADGVQYYVPIWHGNNFTPYVSNPSAVGEIINAVSVNFGGNGATTATGGTAVPSSWFIPNSNNIGSGFWITITKTSGLSGVSFSAGSNVNITNGGLTITANAAASISGNYTLSTSVTGSPVVASGTITLAGGTGPQQPNYNGSVNLVLGGDGTATLGGNASSNWFTPTTPNTGSGFWINITRTGGTAGINFSAAQGAFTNITNGGLTIGLTGSGNRNATGTYQISSNAGGTLIVAQGTITLSSTGVQNSNWSGTAPLVLAGNGTATLNGVSTSSWYSPTTTNIGSSYWINITRTSGTSGVNFSAAQGSWTNITNSGLSISLSGTSGIVGTATASGTYQISSSNTGSPVLGSGNITLNISGLTVIHVYTTVVTNATETILTGSTNVRMEIWGSGAGGTPGTGSGCGGSPGSGGGAGGYARSLYTVSSLGGVGKTFKYTVPAGGTANNNGNTGSITAGTVTGFSAMTANGGNSSLGTGGTASGGNQANTTGGGSGGSRPGGAGVTGVISGDGSPYGGGGQGGASGSGHPGASGAAGAAVFFYS